MKQKQNNQRFWLFLKTKLMSRPRISLLVAGITIIVLISASIIIAGTPQTVTDYFNDTSKIASSGNITVSGGSAALSEATSWSCGDDLVDPRDGKIYGTVLIGSQCWMRQNLNVGLRISTCTSGDCGGSCGSACTTWDTAVQNQGTSCSASDGSDIQKYCYDDLDSNCNSYGGLYQWSQMMCGGTTPGAQGICPAGWHIPTHDEWTTLERAVCTSGTCVTDFPYETGTTGWRGTNEGTTLKTNDSTHFSGLLAGYRSTVGSFSSLSSFAYIWSSLPSGSNAWYRLLSSGYAAVTRTTYGKAAGFSVRCLKN